MEKIIGKFTLIIFVNLFAFLSVGYILDLIFQSGAKMRIIFLILSIFSLVGISSLYFKKALKDIEELSNKGKNKNTKL